MQSQEWMPWKWFGVRIVSIGPKINTDVNAVITAKRKAKTTQLSQSKCFRMIFVPMEKGHTMREKLIDLVCEMWRTDMCIKGCNYPPCYEVRVLVEHLIANGVTIQKWIPVSERLPEEDGEYITLTNAKGKSNGVLAQNYQTSMKRGQKVRRWHWSSRLSPWNTTHWMPMPKPPKTGETE